MALKPVLKLKVDELFLRWISESDTQHMLRENLKHLVRSEPLSATYPVGSGTRSSSKQASPRVRPSSPPLSSSKLPSPRSPRRPLTTKNSQRGHNGNTKVRIHCLFFKSCHFNKKKVHFRVSDQVRVDTNLAV